MDVPEDAPQYCPGTQSEAAGKDSACEGCPNQRICASGVPKLPDPDIPAIKERMDEIKHKLLILSGKGGVGKSTVTALIACTLAQDEEKEIAVLDVDICGPSQPRVLGVLNGEVHKSASGMSPVFVKENLSLMSIGFLLSKPEDAVIWRGDRKTGLIKQFLKDVDWGPLDYLVVDTPPGTSDEHMGLAQFLAKVSDNTAAVIVTTPQEVALLDVRKEIAFCRKANIPIIGIVENMTSFMCPKCKTQSIIFPPTTGGGEALSQEMGVPLLGKVPLNMEVGKACDDGENYIQKFPNTDIANIYMEITKKIHSFYEEAKHS